MKQVNKYRREIRKLAIAIGLLSDAIAWLNTHKTASRAAVGACGGRFIDRLPDGYREALSAHLTDKRKLRTVECATTTKSLCNHLTSWINVFHRLVCEEANRFNRKTQQQTNRESPSARRNALLRAIP
jgi:hypothetical protein